MFSNKQAWQTPHGANPNRDGGVTRAVRHPGRMLDPESNFWARGMTAACRALALGGNRIRLIDLLHLFGLTAQSRLASFRRHIAGPIGAIVPGHLQRLSN